MAKDNVNRSRATEAKFVVSGEDYASGGVQRKRFVARCQVDRRCQLA